MSGASDHRMALPGVLTHSEARSAVAALSHAAAGAAAGADWVIDASALDHFDSTALTVLLEAQRLAAAKQRRLSIHAAPAKLVQLAGLYGLSEVLDFGSGRDAGTDSSGGSPLAAEPGAAPDLVSV